MKLDVWYTGVPDLFYSVMSEVNYRIPLDNGFSLAPGIRYIHQFDEGAGDVGGAALSGTLVNGGATGSGGYQDPGSVDAELVAARLVLQKGAGRLLAGYSRVTDDADFIAPWRGFPTSEYTRPMGQYNWFANTESWMIQAYYDFGKAGIINGFRACADITYIDYDDDKERLGGHILPDLRCFHFDLWYAFPSLPDLEAKLRFSFVDKDDLTNAMSISVFGKDLSYIDFRFELNYLF